MIYGFICVCLMLVGCYVALLGLKDRLELALGALCELQEQQQKCAKSEGAKHIVDMLYKQRSQIDALNDKLDVLEQKLKDESKQEKREKGK